MPVAVEPRYLVAPTPLADLADETHAEGAIALAAGYELVLDDWQELVVRTWMRCLREEPASPAPSWPRWAATTWGVSVARQNGKNASLEAVELYLAAVLGFRILHTAHLLKTARSHFKRMLRYFGRQAGDPKAKYPELNALVEEVRLTNGQEAIILTNGGQIDVTARTSGGGRGDSYDVLVVDEGQEYEEQHQEALAPVISASRTGRPVTVLLGTPPKVVGVRGEPFVRVRDLAVTGEATATAWAEWSAPGDVDKMKDAELAAFIRDRNNVKAGNPAYPHRVTQAAIDGEYAQFSARSFARERLNMWPSPKENQSHPITTATWEPCKIDGDTSGLKLAGIGVDMNPERTKVTITMAYWAPYGLHVEVAADSPYAEAGSDHLADWVKTRARRRIPVVMDAFSPARSLEAHFRQRKMFVRILDAAEWGQACMGLVDAVRDREISHYDQVQLTLSALGAVQEPMGKGGAWKFARQSLDVDLSPINSAVCAHFGAIKFGRRPRSDDAAAGQSGHGFF